MAKLADDLTSKGIYVLFDDYLDSGTTLPMFMEYGIVRSDKVLIIGTPKYKEKCTGISSGVAFEDTIIRGSMFQNLGTKKFIPCLREGEFPESFPIILSGCKGHDFPKMTIMMKPSIIFVEIFMENLVVSDHNWEKYQPTQKIVHMSTEKMQMRTNARLVAKVLTKYRDTFMH